MRYLQQGNGNGSSCGLQCFLGVELTRGTKKQTKERKKILTIFVGTDTLAMYWKKQKILQNPGC